MPGLDKFIHERVRLLILINLASMEQSEISFNDLQERLGFTSGNLSIQLKKLKTADYVQIKKTFKDTKPHTTVALTPKGNRALNKYLSEMENLTKAMKNKKLFQK